MFSASENQLAQAILLNANQVMAVVAIMLVFHNNKWRVKDLRSSV